MFDLTMFLPVLKYAGLVLAAVSSIWGLTHELSVKDNEGKRHLTKAGRTAIGLTVFSLMISLNTAVLENLLKARAADRAKEDKQQLEIRTAQEKQQEALEKLAQQQREEAREQTRREDVRAQRDQIENAAEQQRAKIEEAERSTALEIGLRERREIARELQSTRENLEQLMVDNFLENVPDTVDILMDIPEGVEEVCKEIEGARISVYWALHKSRTANTPSFDISGLVMKSDRFSKCGFEFQADRLKLGTQNNESFRSHQLLIKQNKDASHQAMTSIGLRLHEFTYDVPPWGKMVEFASTNFSMRIETKNGKEWTQFAPNRIRTYLLFDDTFRLDLPFYGDWGERLSLGTQEWQNFRKSVWEEIRKDKPPTSK